MSSFFERVRISLSRILVVFLIIIRVLANGGWEGTGVDLVIFLIGCILVGVGTLGRLWCVLYIAGYKDNTLITEGPYSLCRHPLYFFSFLGAIGVGFASETLLIPSILAVAFWIYYPHVIRDEESRMVQLHADKYQKYKESTPTFFPSFNNFKEPEQYVANPQIFRKNLFDACWFVWLVGVLELVEGLQEYHIIPTYFTIY
ncbi:MAG: isoprenylcysteine carboxylmethyltransferase family protein [Deltaproteobacteria bacterium]|nr:isoprenylcysteine carboxylmethyltransferase family protein [Deltaproteobacteria bacterium]